ncbi:MAG TPA: type II toxin-antitoxin system Phd/YefM family antitoxin [Phycisphaerae bacterium]|nr:type II toxin-antitoxin system Phd/YefM family antitoxin [Phycisphaerae bacterium]
MVNVPISEARERLADLGNRVALRGERVVVERRGKDLFALVPVEDMELLERIEDEMDLAAIRRRLKEPSKSLAKVLKELGL